MLRVVWLLAGLFLFALGIALIISARVGTGPWDVLHVALADHLPIRLGTVMQVTGLAVIAINLLLRIPPTFGMVVNMLAIGPFVQLHLTWLGTPDPAAGRWLMFMAGVLLAGVATAVYTSADLGAGPRDGLMISLTRRFGWPVGAVRNGIELVVACLGWLLGGPLGVGTLLFALTMGPAVQIGMALIRMASRLPGLRGFVRPVDLRPGRLAP